VGCLEEFLSKNVLVVIWLFLFKEERFLRQVFSRKVFWEFLDRTGLTGLPNWSDRFPLPV
jgi:hypothetical protein